MPTSIEDSFEKCKDSNAFRRTLVLIEVIMTDKSVKNPDDDNDRDRLVYNLQIMKKYTGDPIVAETYKTLKQNIEQYNQLK
jgi:hypothetical protein